MGRFEPVVIERSGGHYELRQGEETLFMVPADLFESYEGDAVFPPCWTMLGAGARGEKARCMLWHPQSGEFLMGAMDERPPLLAEVHGSHPFRAYLQSLWLPGDTRLILRIYWNPETPGDAFDEEARRENFRVQMKFIGIIMRLMPPQGTKATLSAVDRYLRLSGITGSGREPDRASLKRTYVTPPLPFRAPESQAALSALATEMVGRAFPTLDAERFLWLETIDEEDAGKAAELLAEKGLLAAWDTYKPH